MCFGGGAVRQSKTCGVNAALQREIRPLPTDADWAQLNFLKQ